MAEQTLSGLNVLVVENDPLNSQALCCLLESYGAQVIGPATSASASAAELLDSKPHITLLDYLLDHGTCEPMVENLKAAKLPYLIVTACSKRLLPINIARERVVSKPFMFDELIAEMCAALDERGLEALQSSSGKSAQQSTRQ